MDEAARKQLVRALIKAIPHLGPMLDDMTYGVQEKAAGKLERDQMNAAIADLVANQNASATDLGDILVRLDKLASGNNELSDTLSSMSRVLFGEAEQSDTSRVQAVLSRVTPEPIVLPAEAATPREPDAHIFRAMLRTQLTQEMLSTLVRDYPGASDWIYHGQGRMPLASGLVECANSAAGRGLLDLYKFVREEVPGFSLDPRPLGR
jgi:hypothetical protein